MKPERHLERSGAQIISHKKTPNSGKLFGVLAKKETNVQFYQLNSSKSFCPEVVPKGIARSALMADELLACEDMA